MSANDALAWLADATGSSIATTLYSCRDFDARDVLIILGSDVMLAASLIVMGLWFSGYVTVALVRQRTAVEMRIMLASAVSPATKIMIGLTFLSCGMTLLVHSLVVLYGPNDAAEAGVRLPAAIVATLTALMLSRSFIRELRR